MKIRSLKTIYLCFLVVYALLREVIVLQNVVGHPILTYGIFGFGLLLIFLDLLQEKLFLKVRYSVWLIAFFAICAISSLVNFQHGLLENAKALCWMLLFFFLIYPAGSENDAKQVRCIFAAFSITMTLLVAISIPMYFFDVSYTYHKLNGTFTDQGFSFLYSRLWGIFQEANYAAIYAEIAGYMAIYLAVTHKKKLVTVLTCLQCILFMAFIVLSGSRTAKLILLVTCTWLLLYYVYHRFKSSNFKRICASICAPILVVAIVIGTTQAFAFVLPYAKVGIRAITDSNATESAYGFYDALYTWGNVDIVESGKDHLSPPPSSSAPSEPNQPNPLQPLNRTDLSDDDDISNGRFNRWKEGFQVFCKVPLLGTSPRGVAGVAIKHLPDSNIAKFQLSISNSYLEVLTYTGIVGAAAIFGFLLLSILHIAKTSATTEFNRETLLVHGMLLTTISSALLESDIFFILTASAINCWFALGILNRQNEQESKLLKIFKKREKK